MHFDLRYLWNGYYLVTVQHVVVGLGHFFRLRRQQRADSFGDRFPMISVQPVAQQTSDAQE
jgi:hypothetical protein